MHGNTSHENREIPGFSRRTRSRAGAGAQREVGRRTPLMHEPGKSDSRVVPKKDPNKARRRVAEGLEGRRLAKRSSPQAATLRTQGRARVDAALGRVRQAASVFVGAVCRHDARQEPGTVCVGKAGISLPVKVRSGQSRADRPAASLAGVAVTRGLKRRQQAHGVYGSNPEMGLLRRPSWKPHQRRQYGCSRHARGRPLRRGLRLGHVRTVDTGTQEVRQGPLVGHQRGRQGREDHRLALCPGRKSDWPIVSMRSPKATR